MTKVTIDAKEYELQAGLTVLQACEAVGVEIPRFCYHERLQVAGNCRMCLVEIQPGPPKPQASCAINIAENMVIKTNTEMVKKAREGAMEFLLVNHPLDCPICDQGGECDLQDQAFKYGKCTSESLEDKRAVEEKSMGPLVKTHMTRCIHCTRCVRFMDEVAGTSELGAFNRGNHTEISTFLNKPLKSNLSGNIIDLCPVGALTAKPYAYQYRSWELKATNSIDVMDALGSAIRVDSKGGDVMRILPRINDDINEEWISDKSRFAFDGLFVQRLDKSYAKDINGKLLPTSMHDAIRVISEKINTLKPNEIAALVGDFVDFETVHELKNLMNFLHSPYTECRQDGAKINTNKRENYIFNSKISGIDRADVLLIVGSNPANESPVLNARIRKAVAAGTLKVYLVGQQAELNYPYTHLGNNRDILLQILENGVIFQNTKTPMLILGQDAITDQNGLDVHNACLAIAQKYLIHDSWNGFNMLHKAAARVGALDVDFTYEGGVSEILDKCQSGDIKMIFLCGADEIDVSKLENTTVVYIGTHGDAAIKYSDIILPSAAYTEKTATYANTEGLYQSTIQAVQPRGESINDVEIIKMISKSVGCTENKAQKLRTDNSKKIQDITSLIGEFSLSNVSFYASDFISRNSKTMAKCIQEIEIPCKTD